MSWRNFCILLGILAFTLSDFLFLSLTLHNQYSIGQLSDDVWLIGLGLLSESFWMRGNKRRRSDSLHPVFIALSVMASATLLAITSLRPGYLPDFIVIPTIATLGLAFVRMTIALKQARAIGEERILARTDELTGLANRRKFLAELNALSADPKRQGALLLLDLDGFKPINDQFGHEVGDQLLRQVSRRFSRALPAGALLARLGGDEFGALILGDYETTLESALALKATLTYPFSIAEHEIRVGVSVGHVGNDGGLDLLRRADLAMYQAKREKIGIWSEPARR
ncbi:MAG: GGDEF domain-containing protein [Actinobacteria bacterium]|nr:GGDEF domain-containing protein [Actinomycetota bacterium]